MTSDLTQIIKAGTLLMIETGYYSDKDYSDPVRVLRDFVKGDVAAEYVAQWTPPYRGWGEDAGAESFLPFLVKAGYVEDAGNVERWHVGEYGSFEP